MNGFKTLNVEMNAYEDMSKEVYSFIQINYLRFSLLPISFSYYARKM